MRRKLPAGRVLSAGGPYSMLRQSKPQYPRGPPENSPTTAQTSAGRIRLFAHRAPIFSLVARARRYAKRAHRIEAALSPNLSGTRASNNPYFALTKQ